MNPPRPGEVEFPSCTILSTCPELFGAEAPKVVESASLVITTPVPPELL